MHSFIRPLALVAVAALAACGGGSGSGSSTPVTPKVTATTSAATQAASTATARVTFKFAKTLSIHKKSAGSTRTPAYVSAAGNSIVVSVNGTVVNDVNNGGVPYFSLSGRNSDGTATISVPIVPGNYASGTITFAEYANSDGTGPGLAYGYNAYYYDSNGAYFDGSANVGAGQTTNLTVTMAMNAAYIGVTTDPIYGGDSTTLSFSSGSPTNFCPTNGTLYYFFPVDAGGNFAPPLVGDTGNGNNNGITSIPTVTYGGSYYNNGATLQQAIFGGNAFIYTSASGYGEVDASFYLYNSVYSMGSPFSGVSNYVPGYFAAQHSC